jgi:hypothetical protein
MASSADRSAPRGNTRCAGHTVQGLADHAGAGLCGRAICPKHFRSSAVKAALAWVAVDAPLLCTSLPDARPASIEYPTTVATL